jgi:hypothetical protein
VLLVWKINDAWPIGVGVHDEFFPGFFAKYKHFSNFFLGNQREQALGDSIILLPYQE